VLAVPQRDVLFYDHLGETRTTMRVPLVRGQPADLAAGEPISDVDWYLRSRESSHWDEATSALFYVGDEHNDEVLNLWHLPLGGGPLRPISDEPYVYGYRVDAARGRVALVVRRGDGPYTSCLVLIPTGLLTIPTDGPPGPLPMPDPIVCDTPEAQFTWTDPVFAPDGSGVALTLQKDGRRDQTNVAWVAFADPQVTLITDPRIRRDRADALEPWLDARRFVYVADDSGFPEAMVYDLGKGESRAITQFGRDVSDMRLLRGERLVLLVTLHHPTGDTLVTVDPETGAELDRQEVDGVVAHQGGDDATEAILSVTSATSPFSLHWLHLEVDGTFALEPWLTLPPETEERLVRCQVEAVSIPTFDIDPATGAQRQLHAYLYTPKDPPADDQRVARVLSFYGGENEFKTDIQVFCDAGIATLSTAVRGSDGFGTAFSQLNDGDLGGDDIADVYAAARWLETARGYPRGRIGVYGRSHGGYATMRALTYPPGTNGHADVYPFAFGMSDAGFSDILSFYEDCNIPDWVVTEAGDPATEHDKLVDRSPLSHVALLTAPLLLTHGEQDNRVPVEGSRRMAAACATAGKDCTYVEFAGQGHQVRGLANERRLYQERFSFLERALASSAAAASVAPVSE
jgi:dipeptidyl aminopeptidase/acylaminoacyl peptidase